MYTFDAILSMGFEARNIQFDQRIISDFCFYTIWKCQHQSDILMPIDSIQIHSSEFKYRVSGIVSQITTDHSLPISMLIFS